MAAYFAIKSYCVYTTNLFFRDIEVINEENVPEQGPVIVYSNHNNQFVDGLLLTSNIKRKVSFVSAAKSMRRNIIGPMLKASEAIPVERPQDVAWKGPGHIESVEGNRVYGHGTRFTEIRPKSSLAIKTQEFFVKEIISDEEIITGTTDYKEIEPNSPYKVIPKLQYHELYHFVWEALNNNRCIGIFPEGGSHDRLELLPFKAGICIMALGAMEKYGCSVTIVPAGFNYYNPQNFRSKVILEFGEPFKIPEEMVHLYKQDKKAAIAKLLDLLESMLKSVTTSARTFDQLSTLFLCRELYSIKSKKELSLKEKLQLNRKFAKGFDALVKEPAFKENYDKLKGFDEFIRMNGLSIKKNSKHSLFSDFIRFLIYFEKCLVRAVIALPGIILMGPTTTLIAYQAEKERIRCLKASNVKVKGNDVVGSYKILLSMIYFPITTGIHTTLFYFGLRKFTEYGREKCLKLSLLIPMLMPIYAMLMVKSYDSFGRSFRKLTLLFLRLFRRSIYDEFNQKKKQMSNKITELVDKYGGEVFEDFQNQRIIKQEQMVGDSSQMIPQQK